MRRLTLSSGSASLVDDGAEERAAESFTRALLVLDALEPAIRVARLDPRQVITAPREVFVVFPPPTARVS